MKKLLLFVVLFNVVLACKNDVLKVNSNEPLTIIPQPKSVTQSQNGFDIKTIKEIKVPHDWNVLESLFVNFFKDNHLGSIKSIQEVKTVAIRIIKNENLSEEAYKLAINSEEVLIEASDYGGAFNALQTFKQLVLNSENHIVNQINIEDEPRFSYRGLMIDCSRHFWTIDELKETINQMAFFKLNKLHLHLTDNNAWRVEIKAYPKLTTVGTYYKDYPELSGKFYTQDELRDLVAYAQKHNIEIIPEIDLPGHAVSVLAAYPEFACFDGQYEAYPEEMPLKDRKASANMLCLGNPEVYAFAEKVIQEIATIFPCNKIHLGGDEVPTNIWKQSPKCQELFKKEGMKEWGELQDYFTKRVSKMVKDVGKTMIGWEEINERHAASQDDIVMVWINYGFNQAIEALQRDVPVIMAPQHGCYYDWGYAGNSTRKVYEWDPISPEMAALNKNDLVLGGQACLWTERVTTQNRVEEMLYPRLTALAEVFWSPKENRNWENYLERLENSYDVMKNLGINYYVDDAINETEFKPKPSKPALLRHAWLTTNVPNHGNYHLEYIFDGKSNTFYWGGRSIGVGDWYEIKLGEPVEVSKIKVITGDSKDYIQHGDLLISEDGETFEKVADFDDLGLAKATLNNKTIRAIRIEVTKPHTNWPVIREIKIE